MYYVIAFLGIISLIGIPITTLIFVIQLIRKKKSKTGWGISIICCLIICFACIIIPTTPPTPNAETMNNDSPTANEIENNDIASESESQNEVSTETEQLPTEDDKTYVSLEEGEKLKEIAGEYAQSFANRPSTVEFDSMSWWVMRNDTTYTVEGYFTCDNGFGASEKYKINVICLMSEDNELLVCMVAINDKVVVDNTEELLGAE